LFIHFHEAFLGQDIVERFVLSKKRCDELEKAFGVKSQEPLQKLRSRDESHDVENIHLPFERTQVATGEHLTLHEEPDDPHELVPNICLAVLDV